MDSFIFIVLLLILVAGNFFVGRMSRQSEIDGLTFRRRKSHAWAVHEHAAAKRLGTSVRYWQNRALSAESVLEKEAEIKALRRPTKKKQ